MGKGADTDCEIGHHYRINVGDKWGMSWSRRADTGYNADHDFVDMTEAQTKDLIGQATPSQTESGWQSTMPAAAAAWYSGQASSVRTGLLNAAKAARAGGFYP